MSKGSVFLSVIRSLSTIKASSSKIPKDFVLTRHIPLPIVSGEKTKKPRTEFRPGLGFELG